MNYQKLRGRIIEKYGTQGNFAKAIGLSEQTITAKMNGRTGFSQADMTAWSELLDIKPSKIGEYFFTPKVSKS